MHILQKLKQNPRFKDHLILIPFQKNYIPYIDALDFFALASYNETYSLSVLDAMMMSKPVIGTNTGGTPEQVGTNERGRLVEAHSASSIAEALRFYLQNPDLATVQGPRARQWAIEKHQWPATLEQFLNLYRTV